MYQEVVVIGKNNPNVYPELEIWGLPISIYLFLGGMAAGILFFCSLFYFINKGEIPRYQQKLSQFATWALVIGVFALLFDLHKILNSWRLYTHIDATAPMSWGAWILLLVIPVAILWSAPFHWHFLKRNTFKSWVEARVDEFRGPLAILQIVLALGLAIYTGLLLSAFVARPLWNSHLLPMLFLVSGLSCGVVLLLWFSKNKKERAVFRRIDLILIVSEIILFIIYIVDLVLGSDAQAAAIRTLIVGDYAIVFWTMIILAGLVLPAILEWKELKGARIPAVAAPVLILLGGLLFRIVIVQAGQLTGL